MNCQASIETREPRGTVALVALGCRVNQAESDGLGAALTASGWSATHDPKRADVVVVNTCAVTSAADGDGRKLIRRIHRANPAARIVVTGCQVERQTEEIRGLPGVRLVVGNAAKNRIPDWVETSWRRRDEDQLGDPSEPPAIDLPPVRESGAFASLPVQPASTKGSRPLVKIQDGCDRSCTFCVIPGTRGPSRSLDEEQVVSHLSCVGGAGLGEAVLTGIDLGSWGADLPAVRRLADLLDRLDQDRPVPRIRLSSLDPRDLSEELAERIASYSWICPHLHLSLQTGSPDVHRRMGRGRWPEALEERVRGIAAARPGLALGLDLLTAFPGETDSDHQRSCDWVRDQPVTYLHVFPYSARPGTVAFPWAPAGGACAGAPSVTALAEGRARELRELGARLKLAFHQSRVGCVEELAVEARGEAGRSTTVRGTTANFIHVEVDAPAALRAGTLLPVEITHADLRGCRARAS